MTSPVALIGLTFDAVDIQATNLSVFFEIVKGIDELPSVRGEDVIVAALAGRIEHNRINDTIQIILKGQVTADPSLTDTDDRRASFRDNMQTVRTLFASDRARADLVATMEDGTVQSISCRPLNIVTERTIASEYWAGSIELEGYDDWAAVVS